MLAQITLIWKSLTPSCCWWRLLFFLQTSPGYLATNFWSVRPTFQLAALASSSLLLPTRFTFPLEKMVAVAGG